MNSKETLQPKPEVWQTAEGHAYLEEFEQLEPDQFAVIKVGGELIDDHGSLMRTSEALSELQIHGLYPMVVHGGGPQIDKLLKEKKITTAQKDGSGLRFTSQEAVPYVQQALEEVNREFCETIGYAGGITEGITDGLFTVSQNNPENFADVSVIDIDKVRLKSIIADGKLAIISSIGKVASGGWANINGDIAACELAAGQKTRKFISLTAIGAVFDSNNIPISEMTATEARSHIEAGAITDGMKVKVERGLWLIKNGVHDFVITSPEHLLEELLTSEGYGTLITQ